jgi:hypothetical protein
MPNGRASEAVAAGMRLTFAVGTVLIVVALAIAIGSQALAWRAAQEGREQESGRGLIVQATEGA